jgi:hypothetical protein
MAENGSGSPGARCFLSCIGLAGRFFISPGPPFWPRRLTAQ